MPSKILKCPYSKGFSSVSTGDNTWGFSLWSLTLFFLFFGKLTTAKCALLTTESITANSLLPGLLWGLLSCLQHMQLHWHIANSFELFWLGCSHLAGTGFAVSCHRLRFQALDSLVSPLVGWWFVILHSLSRVPTLFVLQRLVNIEGWDFPLPTVICSSNSEASSHLLFTVGTSYSRHFPFHCLHWNHYFL